MITQEKALEIVKQAEEEYDPKHIGRLTILVGCVTGCTYGEDAHAESGTLAWLESGRDGNVECVWSSSRGEIAERLATKVNQVAELLSL